MESNLFTKKAFLMFVGCCVMRLASVSGYSTGAPENQCDTMTPGHPGTSLPLKDSPYNISLSIYEYIPFQIITVTIDASELYAGFMIQARDADNVKTTYVGNFEPADDTKFVCGMHGLTHTSITLKDSLSFKWRAPITTSKNVVFRLTVVQNYLDYYVDIRSDVLRPKDALQPENENTSQQTATTLKPKDTTFRNFSTSSSTSTSFSSSKTTSTITAFILTTGTTQLSLPIPNAEATTDVLPNESLMPEIKTLTTQTIGPHIKTNKSQPTTTIITEPNTEMIDQGQNDYNISSTTLPVSQTGPTERIPRTSQSQQTPITTQTLTSSNQHTLITLPTPTTISSSQSSSLSSSTPSTNTTANNINPNHPTTISSSTKTQSSVSNSSSQSTHNKPTSTTNINISLNTTVPAIINTTNNITRELTINESQNINITNEPLQNNTEKRTTPSINEIDKESSTSKYSSTSSSTLENSSTLGSTLENSSLSSASEYFSTLSSSIDNYQSIPTPTDGGESKSTATISPGDGNLVKSPTPPLGNNNLQTTVIDDDDDESLVVFLPLAIIAGMLLVIAAIVVYKHRNSRRGKANMIPFHMFTESSSDVYTSTPS